jgi:hypothetical protein
MAGQISAQLLQYAIELGDGHLIGINMVLYNLRHVEDHEHGLVNFGEDNGLVGI